MSPTKRAGADQIAPTSKILPKSAPPGQDGGLKVPVLKPSARLSEEALLLETDQIDSFVEPEQSTDPTILARLATVSEGQSQEELTAAIRAMRRFVVLQGFGKADPSDTNVKTFARLWSKAEALARNAPASSAESVNLEFGPTFRTLIAGINGTAVSLVLRK